MDLKQVEQNEPFQGISELLGIASNEKTVLSVVGAGGKTTLIFALAKELSALGRRVAVTTTTHIFYPDDSLCRDVVTDGDFKKTDTLLKSAGFVTVGTSAEDGKLSAPSDDMLNYLCDAADILLIEADGSHRLPVKVPNEREPVIFKKTQKIVALCGLSSLGQPIHSACHRAELAEQFLQVKGDHIIDANDLAKLLYYSYGYFGSQLTAVLNQADNNSLWAQAEIISGILRKKGVPRVAITSFFSNRFKYDLA
ncbi:MAG: selenium cofactor biosynthesis protein YqeC [Hydrogenoanaerobacterium sp.]